MRVGDMADLVRAIGGVGQTVGALSAGELRVDRESRGDGYDAGYFPSAERCF